MEKSRKRNSTKSSETLSEDMRKHMQEIHSLNQELISLKHPDSERLQKQCAQLERILAANPSSAASASKPMEYTAHDRYEGLALAWQAAGKPDAVLLHGYALAVLRCWLTSEGANHEKVSPLLKEFAQESDKAQPTGWYDAALRVREHCSVCGERFRIENLKLCTGCSHTYCYQCLSDLGHSQNGNLACFCGGELVG